MLEELSLKSKVVIVTGGGSGLGRAMVIALATAGADIVIAGRRERPMQEVLTEIEKLNRHVVAIPTDVTDSVQVNHMVNQTLNDFGQIDVLINNAGIVREEKQVPIWEITDTAWNLGIDTNLTGAFYCARSVTRHMVERGQGKIINVASASGLRGVRDMYMYCCAKGGVIQLTHTLAVSLGRYGVTANSIVPGYIPTQGTQGMQERLPREEFIPVGHSGQPEDTGPVAVFLASNASDYINGAMFTLDGGALAGGFAPTGYSPTIPLGA